ncbi:MAG: hypothetical protein DRR16_23055 [Candidatus Parabeggiatoa sp. nov. 3]|nr:MAG: hypothetical protein DRR16_23055 [Gammaproteobacteria bacterium]HEW98240.1 hypothetical protein [Beggiatoa sp.]
MLPKTTTLFLSLLLISTIHANAAKKPAIQIIAEDEYGLTLELTLPPFEIETRQTIAQSCDSIVMPTWAKTLKPGYPELPMTSVLIQVPPNGDITTQVIEMQDEILQNVELCPASYQLSVISYQLKNDEASQREAFFPNALLKLEAPGILRGVPVSRLRIFPFQWHPATQALRYVTQIVFQVEFENPIPPTLRKRAVQKPDLSDVYDSVLQTTLLNYTMPASRQTRSEVHRAVPKRLSKQNDALRIEITEAAIYKLSYQDLVDAGLQPQWMKPEHLHLFNQGQEVAIQVISESPFQPGDEIRFYAKGIDNAFTDINVYWLYWRKKGFGKRMAQLDGSVTAEGEKTEAFFERLHFENNQSFWLETPNAPEQDYWFWQRQNAGETKEYTLKVPSPASEPNDVTVRVNFQGRSTAPPHPNHHTVITLNGSVIGEAFWDGDLPYTQEMRVDSELLFEGNNTLTVEMPGDTGAVVDVIYLNWIEIDYWRDFKAVKNRLAFNITANEKKSVTIHGITQSDMLIYDITVPYEVAEISHFTVTGEKRDYQATFETPFMASEKHYLISTRGQIKSPPHITPVQPTQLKSLKNAADYILITAKALIPAVEPLGALRRQQGLRVKLVSVEDIYNEFNHGLFDPAAIKTFLQYAYHHWNSPAPTYVFLVGDANINYKNKRAKKGNQVPAHLSGSWEGLTPDDNWYVSVDGDDRLPDMFIGRIPGHDLETVTALINKIIRFEQSTHDNPDRVLLVADNHSEFEELNDGLSDDLPAKFQADKIYLRSYLEGVDKKERETKIAQATQDIIASFNQGVMISNYIGHGVMDRWSQSKGLFKPDDVHNLNNEEQLAFALMLTCINGYFVNANKYSFAEEFLLAPGGAIGAFAPSNVSYTWEDAILGHEIFASIFERGNRILGAITTEAKIAAYEQGASQNVLQMFTLFGDPAISLKSW